MDILCGTIIFVIILGSLLWGFIEDHIIWPLFKRPALERRRQEEEQELKSFIDPLKSEIKSIVDKKVQQLSVRICNRCKTKGVNLVRISAEFRDHYHTEHKQTHEYRDGYDEYDEYDIDEYDDSELWYQVRISCQKCGNIHFKDYIYYMSHLPDNDKERRIKNYGKEEVTISVDAFLTDIYPRAETFEKNLKAYYQLLDHLRNSWK